MAKKSKTAFVCSNCGQEYGKWVGRCMNCGEWESVTEFRQSKTTPAARRRARGAEGAQVQSLSACNPAEIIRHSTLFDEIDRVLGGGIVPGAAILLGGSPGVGKSTLLIQILAGLARGGLSVLYVSGEESADQISLRAARLGLSDAPMSLFTETAAERALEAMREHEPGIVVIDSVQTMFSEELESAPGSVSQVRECAALLIRYAKEHGATVFLVGHVTKEGAIAGPRVLEHMVDTVLYFEGDSNYQYRVIRAVKNRFGPSGEIALLAMSDAGLAQVDNASELFLVNRSTPQAGAAFVPVLEGSRCLVIELQALVNQSHFGQPQRVASGINPKRLALLIAVLERYGGLLLGDHDIFFSIAGGLSITEPAVDLGVAAALLSSFRNTPVRSGLSLVGEIGLGGEIRPVNNIPARLRELAGLGFTDCIAPPAPKGAAWKKPPHGLRLVPCEHLSRLAELLF